MSMAAMAMVAVQMLMVLVTTSVPMGMAMPTMSAMVTAGTGADDATVVETTLKILAERGPTTMGTAGAVGVDVTVVPMFVAGMR